MLIHRVIDYLDDARAYVSKRALHKRENDELWALHFHWDEYRAELCSQLLSQAFVFSPIREDTLPSHQVVRSLNCVDQLVQKALALALVTFVYWINYLLMWMSRFCGWFIRR